MSILTILLFLLKLVGAFVGGMVFMLLLALLGSLLDRRFPRTWATRAYWWLLRDAGKPLALIFAVAVFSAPLYAPHVVASFVWGWYALADSLGFIAAHEILTGWR